MKKHAELNLLLAAVVFAACSNNDILPDVPDTPAVGRHLLFSGSAGNDNSDTRAKWEDRNNGKLTFAWEYDSTATTSELKMAFLKEGSCLKTTDGQSVTDVWILPHTDAEKSTNTHWAEFKTIGTYDPEMPGSAYDGYTVHAVTPVNAVNGSKVNVDEVNGVFTDTLKMPTTFTQSGADNLEHLSDYLYMYATSTIANGSASLTFNHLAAYVRFKVYNWRGVAASLYSVRMEVVDAESKAASASGISAAYTANGFTYTAATADAGVQVNIAGDEGLLFDDRVFLYAPVFPVGSENAFQGKTLRFILIADDPTYLEQQGDYKYFTYELDDEIFQSVTGSYDWKPGDFYTFHLYLDDVLKVPEVTVNDWTEKVINAGEAEE